jgi:hypothetical protein
MGSIGNAIVFILNEGVSPITTTQNDLENRNKQTNNEINNENQDYILDSVDVRATLDTLRNAIINYNDNDN